MNKYYQTAAIIVLGALFIGAILVFLSFGQNSVEPAEFIIVGGQSLGATARLLAERDLIFSRYIFVAYAILLGKEKEFKAGRYLIPQSVSTHKLVTIFSSGQSEPDDIEVTIPEGTNIADIDKIFAKAGLIRTGDFLKPEIIGLEGYLFPDTYRFSSPVDNLSELNSDRLGTVTAGEIIEKMRENFNLSELSSNRLKKVIIIASILEKEVKTEEDMKLVAGIIEKRLELGMPLELDATVAYGVCYNKFVVGKYCDVSLANVVDNIPIDSEYNTYKRRGLPIGPISNPGFRAIRAVLNPQPSDYLFYLSAKDGTTIFSRTGAEHERARQKHLR